MFRKHKEPPPQTDLQRIELEFVALKEQFRKDRDPRSKDKMIQARNRMIDARNEDRQFRVAVQAGTRQP